jgi:hypothetical protein
LFGCDRFAKKSEKKIISNVSVLDHGSLPQIYSGVITTYVKIYFIDTKKKKRSVLASYTGQENLPKKNAKYDFFVYFTDINNKIIGRQVKSLKNAMILERFIEY